MVKLRRQEMMHTISENLDILLTSVHLRFSVVFVVAQCFSLLCIAWWATVFLFVCFLSFSHCIVCPVSDLRLLFYPFGIFKLF